MVKQLKFQVHIWFWFWFSNSCNIFQFVDFKRGTLLLWNWCAGTIIMTDSYVLLKCFKVAGICIFYDIYLHINAPSLRFTNYIFYLGLLLLYHYLNSWIDQSSNSSYRYRLKSSPETVDIWQALGSLLIFLQVCTC